MELDFSSKMPVQEIKTEISYRNEVSVFRRLGERAFFGANVET
jgi:hypothetical protein